MPSPEIVPAAGVVSVLFLAVDSGVETGGIERVRRVRAADWRALRRCRLQALSLDAASFGTSLDEAAKRPVDHWRDLARQHSEGPDRAILLAIDGEVAVGMIRVEREQPRELFGIYSLWVAPEARRRGLAARLLDGAEKWAVSVGGRRAELFVSADAAPALALYRRSGYRANGRTDDDREDGVVEIGMERTLAG
jgi:ribosomal protein S18 acetylase RimI-like enzyme